MINSLSSSGTSSRSSVETSSQTSIHEKTSVHENTELDSSESSDPRIEKKIAVRSRPRAMEERNMPQRPRQSNRLEREAIVNDGDSIEDQSAPESHATEKEKKSWSEDAKKLHEDLDQLLANLMDLQEFLEGGGSAGQRIKTLYSSLDEMKKPLDRNQKIALVQKIEHNYRGLMKSVDFIQQFHPEDKYRSAEMKRHVEECIAALHRFDRRLTKLCEKYAIPRTTPPVLRNAVENRAADYSEEDDYDNVDDSREGNVTAEDLGNLEYEYDSSVVVEEISNKSTSKDSEPGSSNIIWDDSDTESHVENDSNESAEESPDRSDSEVKLGKPKEVSSSNSNSTSSETSGYTTESSIVD